MPQAALSLTARSYLLFCFGMVPKCCSVDTTKPSATPQCATRNPLRLTLAVDRGQHNDCVRRACFEVAGWALGSRLHSSFTQYGFSSADLYRDAPSE
jgi:hypothetical protein